MIRLDLKQGSNEWVSARLGIATASQFHRILTPKKLGLAAAAVAYLHELLAEWALGAPCRDYQSDFMTRGIEMEDEAVTWYELERSFEVESAADAFATTPGGFVLRNDGMVGCSPDRFVGTDGLLEVKVPGAKGHMANLLGNLLVEEPAGGFPDEHRCQVQGMLLLTGRAWCDCVSYHPTLPSRLVRVERDEEFISVLASAVDLFVGRLIEGRRRLVELGFEAPVSLETGGSDAA